MGDRRINLCGVGGEIDGRQWEGDTLLRVGRQRSFEVVLSDPSISRQHAELMVRPDGGVVRDLGSRNGTFLNGVRVGAAFEVLRDRDVLQCGSVTLRVQFLERAPAPAPAAEDAGPAPAAEDAGRAAGDGHLRASGTFFRIQNAVQHAGQAAEGPAPLRPQRQLRKGDFLPCLQRMGHYLCHLRSLEAVLQSILDDVVTVLDAQRGCVVLGEPDTGRLYLHAAAQPKQTHALPNVFSRTLARYCFASGKSLLCRDVNLDADFQSSSSIRHGGMASVICALIRTPRGQLGVLHLDRGPFQEPFAQEEFELADTLASGIAYGIENGRLLEAERDLFLDTTAALALAAERREPTAGGHARRVTRYALMLARELQVTPAELHQLQTGAPLHDIGKLAVDEAVLRKPGPLTAAEYEQVKAHTTKGAAMLEGIPGLAAVVPIVRSHHERWDGTGYPDGLAGEQIPRTARIVCVADAFDAMLSDRPHRPALSPEAAAQELSAGAGRQFDPACVAAFLEARQRVVAALEQQAGTGETPTALFDTAFQDEIARLLNQHRLDKPVPKPAATD
jgi:putative nucleotidyltransferase with HDIG domain